MSLGNLSNWGLETKNEMIGFNIQRKCWRLLSPRYFPLKSIPELPTTSSLHDSGKTWENLGNKNQIKFATSVCEGGFVKCSSSNKVACVDGRAMLLAWVGMHRKSRLVYLTCS